MFILCGIPIAFILTALKQVTASNCAIYSMVRRGSVMDAVSTFKIATSD